jgi:hypothetical protein
MPGLVALPNAARTPFLPARPGGQPSRRGGPPFLALTESVGQDETASTACHPPRPEERRRRRRVSKGVPERADDDAYRASFETPRFARLLRMGRRFLWPSLPVARCPVARSVGKPLINLELWKEKDLHFLAPDFHFLVLEFHFLAPDFRFLAADFHYLATGLAFPSVRLTKRPEMAPQVFGKARFTPDNGARASPCHPREKRGSRSPATGFSNGILALSRRPRQFARLPFSRG